MPKDKTASHVKIVAAAKAGFLEKGFEGASTRSIGERAGMSAAALYRHYRDKEAMFDSLVLPVIELMEQWMEEHKKLKYGLAAQKAEGNVLFGQTVTDLIKEVVYPHRLEFHLLLGCAQGTKYENFIHDFVAQQQVELTDAIHFMKQQGYQVEEPSQEELHMLLSAYMTAGFEPVVHNYSQENTMHCLDTINKFFMPGWKKIMGL